MSTGPIVALLDTVTFPELMTFLVVALVVLGPEKLPGLARSAGQWVSKIRSMTDNLQNEVKGALDESEMQSLKELGEFAVRPRAKLAEYARKAAEGDPDDHTNGDAPAAVAPTLPPLGVGPDNPMVTNGAIVTTPPEGYIDVDAVITQGPKDPQPARPAHLAGTFLATGGGVGDPPAPPAPDSLPMEAQVEPSADDT